MQAIWGVTDHLRHIRTGDYGKELQCGGVRAMWGVMDRLRHICMGNYSEESHWVVQWRAGHWHHIRAGDMRDGAVLWAIAIISYSEGVGLGDAGVCG